MQPQLYMLASVLIITCLPTQASSQLCGSPCLCPRSPVHCPTGVPQVPDGCGCCQTCARQQGEACNDKFVCDSQKSLQCDYSASYPGGPGECVREEELGCEMNGVTYHEGQTFQPSCDLQCHCTGGGVTCVRLCSEELHPPNLGCVHAQLVQVPGRCCREWICDSIDNSVEQDALAVYRPGLVHMDLMDPSPNCIEQSTEWSPCSRSCDLGVSVRISNVNWACRMETQSRLCLLRPCMPSPHRNTEFQSTGLCESSYTAVTPVRLERQGCYSTQAYRLRYCSLCWDGRCCTPQRTHTVPITFHCPHSRVLHQSFMLIKSCVCHYSCPQTQALAHRASAVWL